MPIDHKPVEVTDVQERMNSVMHYGLDDDMYEDVCNDLREMQIKYNELLRIHQAVTQLNGNT